MTTSFTPEQILSRLGSDHLLSGEDHRSDLFCAAFSLWKPPSIPSLRHGPTGASPSPESRLLCLPCELLDQVLEELDFASLVRLESTSLLAKHLVDTYRPYRDLCTYAPRLVAVLAKACNANGLLRPTDVHRLLYVKECANCGYFGDYFYIPTCERLCYSCLEHDRAYELVGESFIGQTLGLKDQHLKSLPKINASLTGGQKARAENWEMETGGFIASKILAIWSVLKDFLRLRVPSKRPLSDLNRCPEHKLAGPWNFSHGKAIEMALEIHGLDRSTEHVFRSPWKLMYAGTGSAIPVSFQDRYLPVRPLTEGRARQPWELLNKPIIFTVAANVVDTGLRASFQIPYIRPDGGIEHGLTCRGCTRTSQLYRAGELSTEVIRKIQPEQNWSGVIFTNHILTRRTREDLVLHSSHCYGGQQLLRNPDAPESISDPYPLPELPIELFDGPLRAR